MKISFMDVPENAQRTISLTLLGMFTDSSFLQSPNYQLPIYSTPSGMVMFLSLEHL